MKYYAAPFLLFGLTTRILAGPFEDCTLENMRGVTSDAAAKFVREACLRKISSEIALEEVRMDIKATANIAKTQFSASQSLYVNLQNNSKYAITELTIRISTEDGKQVNEYRVNQFLEIYTGPGIVSGLPSDPASYLQIPPYSTRYFAFEVRESPPGQKPWKWNVVGLQGYLPR